MAKSLAPIFFTTCGVVVAGVVGYAVLEPEFGEDKTPVVIAEKAPEVSTKVLEPKVEEQEIAKLEIPETIEPKKAEPEKVELVKPKFDLVRVEKDGSTVVAGQGPGNQKVELMDGDIKLADTIINSTGEFVFVLDKPLAPGSHELFLRLVPEEGKEVLSSSFAFVDVPEPDVLGEVTVLLAEAGKPSQVLQKPKVEPVVTEVAKAEEPLETKEPVVSEEANNEVVSATASATVSVAKPAETSDEGAQIASVVEPKQEEVESVAPIVESKLAPVLIEAADVEAGKIFIAGTGEPKTTINIYLENELLGTARVADNGAFLFEANKDIEAGRHDIRADMIKGSGIEVLARAEVTLVHEPKIAKVEEPFEPKPEPEIVEPEQPVETAVKAEEPIVDAEAEVQPAPVVQEEVQTAVTEAEEEKQEIQTGSAVIIRRGDNLWTVARRNYGAGIRYTTIFNANRDQVRNPDRIYPGQVLKVPEDTQSVE